MRRWVQRHTMEHIVDFVCCAPLVQTLDAPVPQTVEQLQDVLRFFGRLTTVPEQVVEVPKIFLEDVPTRAVLRDPQLVEQLVEVSTVLSLLRIAEQIVGIPVHRGCGKRRVQGSLPRQSSTALPSSHERISERIVEQIVDIPGGGLQDFRQGQSSSSSLHVPTGISEILDKPGEWVFRTFPKNKKVRRPHPPRVRGCPPVSPHPRRLLSTVFVSCSRSWS